MLIGIPTGVKIYDWILTMFRGRVRFSIPVIYAIGFIMLFVIGGMSGIVLANPSLDYQVHNSLFLVAHFHNMLIPGTLFGMLAAYNFWFPKAFGFRLNERWGRVSALGWIIGFMLAFFPLYGLGLLGMPRRSVAFSEPAYVPFTVVALLGAVVLGCALLALFVQLWLSLRHSHDNRVYAGDPWDGRSLEWAVPAPPPEYNFSVLPTITGRDAFTAAKENGHAYQEPAEFTDIELPKNSAVGFVLCVAGALIAFGLVWYMWWLAAAAGLVVLATLLARGFARDTKRFVDADEVRRDHRRWLQAVAAAPAVSRDREFEPANQGHAAHALAGASA